MTDEYSSADYAALFQDSEDGSDGSSFDSASPPDWSQPSAMWSPLQEDSKYDITNIDFSAFTDLDFSQPMAVDPSALQFDLSQFIMPPLEQAKLTTDNLAPSFPFTFASSPEPSISSMSSGEETSPRRMSSASTSSQIPSLALPTEASMLESPSPIKTDSEAAELAQRVRQSAGVLLAVPVGIPTRPASTSVLEAPQPMPTPVQTSKPAPKKASTPKAASPSTSTDPPAPRTKTSHTTIERRYRTNLNARIQALRTVVPALRALVEPSSVNVDARGFADGVRVARKLSKANVLGKAAEYIRVLKRREARLVREQAGLRELVSGLVGGPALLREWEAAWISRFGGPETDEVDGEDCDDSDDDEEEEDGERPRKKPKVAKDKKGDSDAAGVEKRKRGRPRKNPVLAAVPSTAPMEVTSPTIPVPTSSVPVPTQQTLFAVFALFSLFNSPLSSWDRPSSPHAHHGTAVLLTPSSETHSFGWTDFLRVFHLLVTILVFLSIVVPWIPRAWLRTLVASVHRRSSHPSPVPQSQQSKPSAESDLLSALHPSRRGVPEEAAILRSALGVSSGPLGALEGWRRSGTPFAQRQLTQRAWVRLGELLAMDPSASRLSRTHASWRMAWFRVSSAADVATLALLGSRSSALWRRAGQADVLKPYERLVLDSITVEEAAAMFKAGERTMHGPLGALAEKLVFERLRKYAAQLFIQAVNHESNHLLEGDEREAWEKTLTAGRSIGGRARDLCDLFNRIWTQHDADLTEIFPPAASAAFMGYGAPSATEYAVRSLLAALVLYHRVFPSRGVVSVVLNDETMQLRLRQILGAIVFDQDVGVDGLDDARDQVVDMVIGLGRGSRSPAAR